MSSGRTSLALRRRAGTKIRHTRTSSTRHTARYMRQCWAVAACRSLYSQHNLLRLSRVHCRHRCSSCLTSYSRRAVLHPYSPGHVNKRTPCSHQSLGQRMCAVLTRAASSARSEGSRGYKLQIIMLIMGLIYLMDNLSNIT